MILKGLVTRIGSARVNGPYETVDALEVEGYPEVRTINGTSYIIDHIRSAVGEDAVIGISNSIVVAVKTSGVTYSETGFRTIVNSGGVGLAGLVILSIMPGICLFPVPLVGLAVYFHLRKKVRRLVAQVEGS